MKLLVSLSATEWRYAMVNRPAGFGGSPQNGIVAILPRPKRGDPHYDMARNGVAVYNRRLTDQETKSFEMALMVDGKDRAPYVKLVVDDMREYGKEHLEEAEEDFTQFVRDVYNRMRELVKGYQPSIGNVEDFAKLVHKELSK